MSGHSKWHNIRVKKTAEDARRGKIYTRHARLVEMAARSGGGDPDTNAGLRAAIDNARAENVPNANIDRAIKKGLGDLKGEQMAEILYAAYGPSGVACLIECITDNKNRTLANVKLAVGKRGGNFAETGSVQWMFARKGVVVAKRGVAAKQTPEELELELIDFGAEDIDVEGDTLTITTDIGNWAPVRDFCAKNGYEIVSAGQQYVPTQKTVVSAQAAEKLMEFVEAIEEDDDVSQVFTNADIAE